MVHDIRQIFELAIGHSASDVVVTRGSAIAYKINGRWAQVNADPLTTEGSKELVYSILSPEQIVRLERDRELDFSFEIEAKGPAAPAASAPAAPAPAPAPAEPRPAPSEGTRRIEVRNEASPPVEGTRRIELPKDASGKDSVRERLIRFRFRGNAFFQRGALGAVFRLIPRDLPTIDQLGLPVVLESFALQSQGLVLVTGPTGHGKTTTLAAMVDTINRNKRCHVVTIEDPIEYVHKNRMAIIEQREVGDDTRSFAGALRHALRQAPDVILVGELRDPETFSAALTAAETGHLVLATVHTNDCVKTIDRIVDSFSPHQQSQVRSQVALTLSAIVSQRLIPTQDGKGRVVAAELLINNTAVANLIREQKIYQIYNVIETASKDGMMTMDSSIMRLYQSGRISIAEAKLRLKNPGLLDARRPDDKAPPSASSSGIQRPGTR